MRMNFEVIWMKKNLFFKRLFAYLLDMLLISLVLGLITSFIPQSENSKKLAIEQQTITSDFIENRVEAKEFVNRSLEIGYDQAKEEIPLVFLNILVMILYFIVFQAYNHGQTIGKKLVKIKVVANHRKQLNLNDYFKRSIVIPPILCNLLDLILLMFVNKDIYLTSNLILTAAQILLLLIAGFMVIYRKDARGLHDLIADTKVVLEKGDVKSENV